MLDTRLITTTLGALALPGMSPAAAHPLRLSQVEAAMTHDGTPPLIGMSGQDLDTALQALPPAPPAHPPPLPAPPVAPEVARPLLRPRVLLIEDDSGFAALVQEVLSPTLTVVHVDTAHAALAALARPERYAGVLCDLHLPDSGARDTMQDVLTACAGLPCIAMSATLWLYPRTTQGTVQCEKTEIDWLTFPAFVHAAFGLGREGA